MEIVPGFDRAQSDYEKKEPPDYSDLMCSCGHKNEDHNGADECGVGDCECECFEEVLE